VAAHSGQQHAAELLLDSGATADVADVHGVTALMAACGRGHVGLARALLRSGADVTRCDHQGRNALHYGAPGALLRPDQGSGLSPYCAMSPDRRGAVEGVGNQRVTVDLSCR